MSRKNKFTIALLSTSHLVMDSYSSFLYQLLPMMAMRLNLTPAQAGLLPPTLTIASSLLQPVYGIISDKYLKRSMAVFGPLIAAVFLSLMGTATSLPMLVALVVIGGIGVGMFHPQGAALVSKAALEDGRTDNQGFVMSVFSSSGTVGYALGPILVAAVVGSYGLSKSWYTMIWGVVFWIVLFRFCPSLEIKKKAAGAPRMTEILRSVWVPLTLLYFAVVLRSAVSVSVGGTLADKLGARRVTFVAMLIASPLLFASFSTEGMKSYALLMAAGTALNLPIPISVVMAQRLVPGGASTVSALVMGFAWGAGALMTPLTGLLSERFGFTQALMVLAILPLASAALLWKYPKDDVHARTHLREALATD
ncbi:MAG: MFS transporter [Acidobacteria bacterium]|nr:MFS transporter [Acidobacteriota bacterium]